MFIHGTTDTVLLKVSGRVARLELNRPDQYNALDPEMIRAITVALKEVAHMDETDVLVIAGNGKGFCAGGDIKSMLAKEVNDSFFQVMDLINEMVINLYCSPKLTISEVHGAAAGLGFSLALASDYIIADESTRLAMNFIGIGLIPDGGAHFFLNRRLGEHKTKRLIWEGEKLTAREAYNRGLIDKLVEDGNLRRAVDEKVEDWLNKPLQAMIKTKKILAEVNRPELLKVLELEKHGQYKMRQTHDHREGVSAFIEKRMPNFKGE
ncbi:enoyl-CoA hydratase [Bacillus sp. HMF5848]|uniref:enoyl-CoA hydratase n=1 Tax=Bacillus sp. HMF5848 TaxID=2495421 RepID=UPI000F7B3E01|nr:enoyl-CoA hydratase [Bacillus sp. HMF5848]RSK26309.1 enoyl-CoA hydratase [Bacillus sp. HMF5848]